MLERHEIEAFLTLAEELHFGRTAARLRVSPTRISQTIRKLERRVGAPLFHRTSRRVDLSELGQRLHDEVRPAWRRIGAALEAAIAAGHGVTGTLRVAFVGAAAARLLVRATEVFGRRMPGCTVQVREAHIVDVLPWLHHREIDMAFSALPVPDSHVATGLVLLSEARMLAVPAEHPLARRESVSVEDLAGIPMIQLAGLPDVYRDNFNPTVTPAGRPIPRGPAARTFNEILTLIGAGQGAFSVGAPVTHYYSRPDVAYVPIHDAPPIHWGLIWRADAADARIHAFAEAAREAAQVPPAR